MTPTIQRFTVTITAGNTAVTATRGVTGGFDVVAPPSRTIPAISQRINNGVAGNSYGTNAVISAWASDGETITFTRQNTDSDTIINVEVATFPADSGVVTQQVSVVMSGVTSVTETIDEPISGHGRFIVPHSMNSNQVGSTGSVAGLASWALDSDTQVSLTRSSAIGTCHGSATVVDYFGATVQSVALNVTGVTGADDYAISTVDTSRTALFGSMRNGSTGSAQARVWAPYLTSATNVRLVRCNSTENVSMLGTLYVVEFPADDAVVQVLDAQQMDDNVLQLDYALPTPVAAGRTLLQAKWLGRSHFGLLSTGGDTPTPHNGAYTTVPVLSEADITHIRANRTTGRGTGPDVAEQLYFQAITWPEASSGDVEEVSSVGCGILAGAVALLTLLTTIPAMVAGGSLATGSATITQAVASTASANTLHTGSAELSQRIALETRGSVLISGQAGLTQQSGVTTAAGEIASGRALLTQQTALSTAGSGISAGDAFLTQVADITALQSSSASISAAGTVPIVIARTFAPQGGPLVSGSAQLTVATEATAISAGGSTLGAGDAVPIVLGRSLAPQGGVLGSGSALLSAGLPPTLLETRGAGLCSSAVAGITLQFSIGATTDVIVSHSASLGLRTAEITTSSTLVSGSAQLTQIVDVTSLSGVVASARAALTQRLLVETAGTPLVAATAVATVGVIGNVEADLEAGSDSNGGVSATGSVDAGLETTIDGQATISVSGTVEAALENGADGSAEVSLTALVDGAMELTQDATAAISLTGVADVNAEITSASVMYGTLVGITKLNVVQVLTSDVVIGQETAPVLVEGITTPVAVNPINTSVVANAITNAITVAQINTTVEVQQITTTIILAEET